MAKRGRKPKSSKAKFKTNRQKSPKKFEFIRTVDFNPKSLQRVGVKYRGSKFKKYFKKSTGAKARVGRLKKRDTKGRIKWGTQSILIPKSDKNN